MKRRWLGVLIAVWVSVILPFTGIVGASAAGENYKFDALGDIVGTGTVNGTFIAASGGTFVHTLNVGLPGQPCSIIYTIDSVTKNGAASSGHVSTVAAPAGPSCSTNSPLNGNITIAAAGGGGGGGGGGAGSFTLAADTHTIATTGVLDTQGNPISFTYSPTDLQYEYTGSTICCNSTNPVDFTDTITNLLPIKNSTNYSATLTINASGGDGNPKTSTITVLAAKSTPPPPVSTGPTAANGPVTCDAGKGFTWLICGIIQTAVGAIDWIRDQIIVPFLIEKPLDKNTDKDAAAMYNVWSGFRNVASIFFILIFFIIIFGTALNWDNYTVKKALPRLIAGAIFVPFSWYICVLVIDISNILGQGLVAITGSLIPASTISFTSDISKLLLGGLLVGGAVAAFGALATIGMGIVISMLLGLLLVFLTLVLRKILITLLIIISPFAFVAWILPNTEKWFKEWWTNFLKLAMMYPIIMMLFEAGRLFAATAGATSGNALENGVTPFFQLVGLMLPLFGVPFAFKWAGSALGAGNKAIGRVSGSLDKSYGKDSARAKDRAQQRMVNNADRSLDPKNPMNSKTLGAMKRSVTLRRSGLGGFAGNTGIPLLRNNAAQKMRVNSASAKYQSDKAKSDATDRMRALEPESNAHTIHNMTETDLSKLKDERTHEEAEAMKTDYGVSVKDVNLTSGDEDSSARIAAARATGNQAEVIAQLKASTGGIDHIEAMIQEQFLPGVTPDQAKIGAALQRLSVSNSGFDRAQDLASGRVVDVKDADGKVIGYKGGGGVNGDDGQKALLGGDDTHNVADKWQETWMRGVKDAASRDSKKSLAASAVDFSGEDLAKDSPNMARRLVAFYDRNRTGPLAERAAQGTIDFNQAAQAMYDSPVLRRQALTNVKTAIAASSELPQPIISPVLGAKYRADITPRPAPPATPQAVGRAVVAATGGNVVHVQQIHRQITNEIEASGDAKFSQTQKNIETHLLEHPQLKAEHLDALGIPTAPQPLAPGEEQMPPALERHVVEALGDNLDALASLERRFATDADYRTKVKDSYLRGGPVPPAS